DAPGQTLTRAQTGAGDAGRAKAAPGGVFQYLGVRIQQQDVGGIDAHHGRNLLDQDVKGNVQVETRTDGDVDGAQGGQLLDLALDLRLCPLLLRNIGQYTVDSC